MKPTTKNDRPVNLDLSTIKLPLAAITSITHRISGVIMFVGIGILLWMLELSLSGETGFNRLQKLLTSPLATFVVWGVLSALAYHLIAGVKHLLMDAGIGETKEGAPRGATIVIVVSLLTILALGVWLWV
ncbi:succinate dehydrogenase, cytochrome b556 subunit [Gammaproteobacteria bacterium]|nr:succinate dehydrogenase, cytochrome b556 subunit [Gammaproteobacteria bacterium]